MSITKKQMYVAFELAFDFRAEQVRKLNAAGNELYALARTEAQAHAIRNQKLRRGDQTVSSDLWDELTEKADAEFAKIKHVESTCPDCLDVCRGNRLTRHRPCHATLEYSK